MPYSLMVTIYTQIFTVNIYTIETVHQNKALRGGWGEMGKGIGGYVVMGKKNKTLDKKLSTPKYF